MVHVANNQGDHIRWFTVLSLDNQSLIIPVSRSVDWSLEDDLCASSVCGKVGCGRARVSEWSGGGGSQLTGARLADGRREEAGGWPGGAAACVAGQPGGQTTVGVVLKVGSPTLFKFMLL